ncbi:MAG: SOS response-associated peptidase [Balneolaceae bacterium]|nr:SOS response-associated peptidase [Balneolaceae bacterium]
MSDRFVLHAPQETVEKQFGVTTQRSDFFEPDYNINPGSRVPVVYHEEGERKIYDFLWGMIPQDAQSEKEGLRNLTIPVEALSDERYEPSFRERRCIVPANGFYKWKTGEKKSTPFYIRMLSNEVIGLAALYSVWEASSGRKVYSFALLNTEANALVQPVDTRMPVILKPKDYATWLGEGETELSTNSEILKPFDLTKMAVNRVTENVNDPENNSPELIQPIPK